MPIKPPNGEPKHPQNSSEVLRPGRNPKGDSKVETPRVGGVSLKV